LIQTEIPGSLAGHIVDLFGDDGRVWLEHLPATIAGCEQIWSLTVLPPFDNLSYNYVAPAVRADGLNAILKIGVPNPELSTEIEALLRFDGRGSVRLLAVDRERGALLLERLKPGRPLADLADDEQATHIAAQVMRELWHPVPPGHSFPTVARWAAGLDRMRLHFDGGTGPLPRPLVEKAERLFADLLASMQQPVLLHGDLHHWNILSAERRPWLAIDPKGVVGEPAYEVGALLRNLSPRLLELPQPSRIVARRLDILAEDLGFDRERLLSWGLAQAILSAWWSIEDHGQGWEWAVYCAELLSAAAQP
jgi:streptomycin 6-kinase